jgi:hypothetical protein
MQMAQVKEPNNELKAIGKDLITAISIGRIQTSVRTSLCIMLRITVVRRMQEK